MAELLEHPLVFAGCGLRDAEFTLWWLLATKARHGARHDACPSIFITTPPAESESLETDLRNELLSELNCNVVTVTCYKQVWQVVQDLLEAKPNQRQGEPGKPERRGTGGRNVSRKEKSR